MHDNTRRNFLGSLGVTTLAACAALIVTARTIPGVGSAALLAPGLLAPSGHGFHHDTGKHCLVMASVVLSDAAA